MDNPPIPVELPENNKHEMAFLYQLGIALASGTDLFTTLLTLQTEILKLIPADAFFVAMYDEASDMIEFPIYFEVGVPRHYPPRKLSERPGLTGAVIRIAETLYLPDMMEAETIRYYAPINDNDEPALRTFLGIPLFVKRKVMGVLSVQTRQTDAYTADQIRFMENVSLQAALAIDKAHLLDQLKHELVERKKMEIDLRQRESILEAVTFAAEQFLKSANWRLHIDTVLERFGMTMHVTHAYLFEDSLDEQGDPVTSMRYEWTAPGYESSLGKPEYQNSKIDEEGYEDQVATLRRGEVRVGNSRTFNPIEKGAMDSSGVKAILEVPILVNQKDWGAIGFDDYEDVREWTSAEIDALKVAGGILGAAIQREMADSAVQESERIYRQAIEAADAIPYYYDFASTNYVFIGEGIRNMTGYEPAEITPALWSRIIEESITLREANESSASPTTAGLQKSRLQARKRDQKIRTRNGNVRWLTDRSIQLFDERNVSYGIIGILQDITDRKATESGLRKRESILQAITFSAEQFLKTSNWRENIDVVLERLGTELEASHAYLFEHHSDEKGNRVSSMRYEWAAPGCQSELQNPLFQNSDFLEGPDSTDETLRSGQIFIGNTSTFPEPEREQLESLGIKALIELPILVRDEWWGTIGMDDMFVEREWSAAELDALKVAADILSAVIQRQEAEEAVHESERIYRQAIEAAGAVPYFQDYQSNTYTFIGKGIREITGYEPQEVNPDVWDSMILESDMTGELTGLDEQEAIQLVREGSTKAWTCDYRIRAQDGTIRWIADSAVELFGDGGGQSHGSIGIMQDITQRKQVEADLRKGEAILEVVASAANTFLRISEWKASTWQFEVDKLLERLGTTINASHVYLFENEISDGQPMRMSMRYEWTAPGYESDLGNEDFIGISLDTFKMASWNERVTNGLPYIGDVEHASATDMQDLRNRNIQALLDVPIFVDGKWWGTIGFDDMSAPRVWSATEVDALVVAATLLGAGVKRNQMDLILQNELTQRQELIAELESKNQELERFTYTVSHDLKSPLVTISGFLGYLEQDALSGRVDRVKQDSQRIQEAVRKMQRLLTELLELSRIGRIMNPPQEIPFVELVHESMDLVHGRLEEHGIQMNVQPGLPMVYGDRPRLLEVLQNLLDNAAKYMGDQPHPVIEIGQRGEEDGRPVFYVRDNGMGIAPEHHERIFGLFNKLDARTEGTGVGLALVKRIIEIHGGRIWVESEPQHGTTFFFTLPRPTTERPDSVI